LIVFLIPVAAVVLAMLYVRWVRQPEKPLDPMQQVEAYQRMVAAMERRVPAPARPRERQSTE